MRKNRLIFFFFFASEMLLWHEEELLLHERNYFCTLAGFSRLLTFSGYCCIHTLMLIPDSFIQIFLFEQERKWPGWKILNRIDDNFPRRIGIFIRKDCSGCLYCYKSVNGRRIEYWLPRNNQVGCYNQFSRRYKVRLNFIIY